ncbi:MAG TPA: hypothetical protein VFO35_11355 [Steroidobacteraceae bacterium]|nr:hypothetical protein [Steroidobacteraceae bacterium]
MSAVQLSGSAVPMPGGDSLPQAPIDIGRAEDVYAAWKAVFEGSRAVEHGPDDSCAWQHDAAASEGERPVRNDGEDGQSGGSVHDGADTTARMYGKAAAERAPMSSPTIATLALGSSTATVTSSGSSFGTPPLAGTTAAKAAVVQSSAARSIPQSADALSSSPQPNPADVVQVFVRGSSVAIVVRDSSLSADAAMHCAFQAARELTGRSDGLRYLTLNGRTIYQQPDTSEARERGTGPRPDAAVLEFAC